MAGTAHHTIALAGIALASAMVCACAQPAAAPTVAPAPAPTPGTLLDQFLEQRRLEQEERRKPITEPLRGWYLPKMARDESGVANA